MSDEGVVTMNTESPVYMIVQLKIENLESFRSDYAPSIGAINERHGVEVIVGTPEVDILEGDYERNFTVVLKFPSKAAQQAWYSDPDYLPLKELRLRITAQDQSSIIVANAYQAA